VLSSRRLDELVGSDLLFKCENLQHSGSFKLRGATNAVWSLSDAEAARGVVTHSSGNHGAALARAAATRGIACHVVMPRGAPRVKREAVLAYGAGVEECEPNQESREETAALVIERTGARLVHPYEDPWVIAGQGTCALELLEDEPEIDLLLVPLGGGGLLSGTLIAASERSAGLQVVGVEPEGADDARRSLEAGRIVPVARPRTVAEGLRATLGTLPFAILQAAGCSVVTVDDGQILRAMRLLWERLRVVVEASAAVPMAAILSGAVEVSGRRVGLILSGGNVDLPAGIFTASAQ
jgi:threonine dehydratase